MLKDFAQMGNIQGRLGGVEAFIVRKVPAGQFKAEGKVAGAGKFIESQALGTDFERDGGGRFRGVERLEDIVVPVKS